MYVCVGCVCGWVGGVGVSMLWKTERDEGGVGGWGSVGAWQRGRRHQRLGETGDKEHRRAGRQRKRDPPCDPERHACLRRLAAAIHIF